jgi:hypothetical protein
MYLWEFGGRGFRARLAALEVLPYVFLSLPYCLHQCFFALPFTKPVSSKSFPRDRRECVSGGRVSGTRPIEIRGTKCSLLSEDYTLHDKRERHH